jgi:magnesium-transporting ATPase (P-type)
MLESVSAIVFAILTGIVIIFQGCLAAGVPWGEASMGGKYPGKYPPKMRVVAIMNMMILSFLVGIVLSRADLLFPQLKSISNIGIWVVVVFFTIGTVLNTITPSKIERIWAPVALVQCVTSIIVAIS